MNEKNFKQPLVFFFNGVNSIISCNCYVSWSAERTVNRRHNMINDDYLRVDSKYDSISDFFQNNFKPTLYGLGKLGSDSIHLYTVLRVTLHNFIKSFTSTVSSSLNNIKTTHITYRRIICAFLYIINKKYFCVNNYEKVCCVMFFIMLSYE